LTRVSASQCGSWESNLLDANPAL